ncbi:MAG: aromatic-ring-hydroxylating dioxygenase subunit beta [Proteobacteria bacterium]|nr:aromatic-ring-hydroxylating dioxygenase subunit beta [Pseudomonadota bacterium]
MLEPVTVQALRDFVLLESELLASGSFDAWLELFDEDGHYWVPLDGAAQPGALHHASLAYEDRLLLAMRIQRMKGPNAHSLQPGVRGMHVLQLPRVERLDHDANEFHVRTHFVYSETRGDREATLAGVWRHQLRNTPAGLRIRLKRVDLLNASAAHEAIQLFP